MKKHWRCARCSVRLVACPRVLFSGRLHARMTTRGEITFITKATFNCTDPRFSPKEVAKITLYVFARVVASSSCFSNYVASLLPTLPDPVMFLSAQLCVLAVPPPLAPTGTRLVAPVSVVHALTVLSSSSLEWRGWSP